MKTIFKNNNVNQKAVIWLIPNLFFNYWVDSILGSR